MSGVGRDRSIALETGAFALLAAFAFLLPLRHALAVPVEVPAVPYVGPAVEAPRGLSIGPLVAAALVLVWALAAFVERSPRRPHPFHAAFALFAAFAAASYRWTIDTSATLTRIAILGYVFILLVIAWDLLESRRRIAIVSQAVVLGAFVVGLVGAVEVVQQGGITREDPLAGANPNELARWLIVAAPLAAGLLANSRRFGSAPFGYLNVAYLVALPFTILATGSRQGVVALLVLGALGSVAVVARRDATGVHRRHAAAGLALLVATVAAVRALGSVDAFLYRRPFALDQLGSLGGRTAYWAEGLDAFRAHPIRGVGAGGFDALTPAGMSADPHNTFVGVAAELGLPGLLLFAAAVAIPAIVAARRPGPSCSSAGVLLALALFSTVAMLYNDPFIWLVLLLVLAAHSTATADRERVDDLAVRAAGREPGRGRAEPVSDGAGPPGGRSDQGGSSRGTDSSSSRSSA